MRFVIDRIENDIAVVELETAEMVTVPTKILGDAKEGDAILLTIEEKPTNTHSIFEKLRNK